MTTATSTTPKATKNKAASADIIVSTETKLGQLLQDDRIIVRLPPSQFAGIQGLKAADQPVHSLEPSPSFPLSSPSITHQQNAHLPSQPNRYQQDFIRSHPNLNLAEIQSRAVMMKAQQSRQPPVSLHVARQTSPMQASQTSSSVRTNPQMPQTRAPPMLQSYAQTAAFPQRPSAPTDRNTTNAPGQPAKKSGHHTQQEASNASYSRPQSAMPQFNRSMVNSAQSTRVPQPINHPNNPRFTRTPIQQKEGWQNWGELTVKLYQMPEDVYANELRDCFAKEGEVVFLDLYGNSRGGIVKFKPPPDRPFWEDNHYTIRLEDGRVFHPTMRLGEYRHPKLIPSPVNPNIRYPEYLGLKAKTLDFGVMLQKDTLMSKAQVDATKTCPVEFGVDLYNTEIKVEFGLHMSKGQVAAGAAAMEIFKFVVPFKQMGNIARVTASPNTVVLLFTLETPPKYFRRIGSRDKAMKARSWSPKKMWYRQTDLADAPTKFKKSAVTLKNTGKMLLDLGRWTTYRLVLHTPKVEDGDKFDQMNQILKDHNIDIVSFSEELKLVPPTTPEIWSCIDPDVARNNTVRSDLLELIQQDEPALSFEVRYQLEVCISAGVFNEHNLTKEFAAKLIDMDQDAAKDLLIYLTQEKERIWDPMSIFDLSVPSTSTGRIPHYCALVHSVTVTPTTLRFSTPTVETSNRIIRQYPKYSDRFLRVRFTDELKEGKIYSDPDGTSNSVFSRIKRAMVNGIVVGGRHYRLLAFGNSQFREHGAYFFSPVPQLRIRDIRIWMGSFDHIRSVALFASRLGQCFSTTRAITTQAEIEEVDDVERNGFMFSDGVGKISPILAQLTADDLGLSRKGSGPPSVFQFRLGGCKGVLGIWPDLKGKQIHIRETQYKFPASHEGLEVIRCSQFASANLNRQIIIVLSSLGVPDAVFQQKLEEELKGIEDAMINPDKALEILQSHIDHNQMTLKLAGLIIDGFQSRNEPFIMSLLHLWRAWSIKSLKEKAKITVTDGAVLLGILDETATLKGHYNNFPKLPDSASVEEKAKHIPEIFVQLSRGPEDRPKVILGPMLLARNPSLHPGDMRVVRGVDKPELRHLKDCVVLPQTGDRDVASMCSGGDLDGDDFAVIWDQDLLPPEWNHEPMDYTPPKRIIHDGPITDDNLVDFFTDYIQMDTLPTIAHSHLAIADYASRGVKDERCLKLAALHSMAVDYVKTGQPAQMEPDLKPKHWPHFMEKKNKNKEYHSKKVLGKLYDRVERVAFVPVFTTDFDEQILNAFDHEEEFLSQVRHLKRGYDDHMRRIMAQHAIKTEYEVWSTFAMSHNGASEYKFGEEIGRISSALKDQFRDICYQKAGGKAYEELAPFVAAMYKVTAEEMTKAIKEHEEDSTSMTAESMPFMTFPWLFQDVLGKIAKMNAFGPGQADPSSNMDDGTQLAREAAPGAILRTARAPVVMNPEDDLRTAQGITHRGDTLELFDKRSARPPKEPEEESTEQTERVQMPRSEESSSCSSSNAVGSQRIGVERAMLQKPGSNESTSSSSSDALGHGEAETTSTTSEEDSEEEGAEEMVTLEQPRANIYDKFAALALDEEMD